MDKNSSLRCLKFSLIAGNSAVIALGLAGFITGLVAPNAMQHLGVSGSQLALVSSIAVVISAAGLIGALREHFCLLLTYALCIFSVFIFRLTWSLTTPLHQSGRFVMDTAVSLTLLSSLTKLFLMIFAILLALTAQNSLPLTKQKFLYLKDKLKLKNQKTSKNEIDSVDHTKKMPMKSKSKPSKLLKNVEPNGIYVCSASHNIYESGRRRSPSSRMMMNGHHHGHGHHGHHNGSAGRSSRRHYQAGVGYSGPTSPNESAHSSASQDSNNNSKQQHQNGKLPNETMSIQQQKNQTQSLPRVPAPRRGHKIYSSSSDYIHYRSPSPPSKVSTTNTNAGEAPIQQQNVSKLTNQPFFNPYRSLPKSSNKVPSSISTSITTTNSASVPKTSIVSSNQSLASTTTTFSRPTAMPRSALYSSAYTMTTSTSKPNTYSPYSQPNRYNNQTLPSSRYTTTSPVTSYSSRTGVSNATTTSITSPTITSRLYSSSPSIIPTTSSIIQMIDALETTTSQSNSIFTMPSYSSSYQLGDGKLFGSSPSYYPNKNTTVTTTTTNLSQTRNLFSTYTSPYTSQVSTTPPIVEENMSDQRPLSPTPIPAYRSYRSSATTTNKQPSYSIKSPTPSPTINHQKNSSFQWSSSRSSRTPTPPVTTTSSSITSRYTSSKLFSSPSSSMMSTTQYSTSTSTYITTTSSSRSSIFTTPAYSSSLTYPRVHTSNSSSIPTTITTTTTSSTMSNNKYRFFYSSNSSMKPITTTTPSSSVNLFTRVYPKTYEEYVKSYRYPESSYQSLSSSSITNKRGGLMEDNTMVTIDSTSSPHENVFVVTGYNHSSGTKNAGAGFIEQPSVKNNVTATRVMKTLTQTTTTTTQREVNEQQQQKRTIYKQQTLFHET